jgi:hypothetical protein
VINYASIAKHFLPISVVCSDNRCPKEATMKEVSTVFDIGPNSDPATVLSLKGNSRLLRDIGAGLGDVYIEFTSASSARIIAGEEEYDLTFADVKSTVS